MLTKIDDITYQLPNGKELWFHSVMREWFCWECGKFDCEHVQELNAQVTDEKPPKKATNAR